MSNVETGRQRDKKMACLPVAHFPVWPQESGANIIESYSKRVGQFVAGLLGMAWSIVTCLIVPVLVVEKAGPATHHPKDAFVCDQNEVTLEVRGGMSPGAMGQTVSAVLARGFLHPRPAFCRGTHSP
jgi:hypothetical protein